MNDFLNEPMIGRLCQSLGLISLSVREGYTSVQDDSPQSWTLTGTLSYLGLGSRTPETRPSSAAKEKDATKYGFADL